MRQTRLLLVGMHGLLGEIIRETLEREPDLEIVGELTGLDQLRPSQVAVVDVVVACLGEESSLPRPWYDLARERRRGRLLLILDDGRRASLYNPDAAGLALDALSPASLVEAIRGPEPLTTARA